MSLFFFSYSYSKSFFSPCVCRPPEQRWKRRSPKHVRISSQSLSLKALTSLGTSPSLPKVSPHNGLHKRWREWTPSRRTRASGGKENSRAPYIVRRDPLQSSSSLTPSLDGGDDTEKLIVAAFKRYCVSNPLHPDVFPGTSSSSPLLPGVRLTPIQLFVKWRPKSWRCASGCKHHIIGAWA